MALEVIGVRHHSPACAGLVRRRLTALRPRWVLIEGPADMNPRLDELLLEHEPPLALYSYHFDGDLRQVSWAPFCVHSPEWVALREGRRLGARLRFIDLPAWASELAGVENRYADRRSEQELSALEQATGERGYDAAWDACFELPEPAGLQERLERYFDHLREREPASDEDLGRERFMGDSVAWARGQGGDVLVVCGGFHAPALRAAASRSVAEEPRPPRPSAGARHGSFLIPFDQGRLDSFRGYASGLPSPAYYRWVWELGPEAASRRALRGAAEALRAKGQVISTADTVAAWTQAQGLARLRGRAQVARGDLLDAVASTWVKEALAHPLPWTRRRQLQPGTNAVVVELLRSLSGQRRGRLAPETPLPPLVAHVDTALRGAALLPPLRGSRRVTLQLDEKDRRALLERLRILRIPGFEPEPVKRDGSQVWILRSDPDFEAALLLAASYGPSLEEAARAALGERALSAEGYATLLEVLRAAFGAGLPGLSQRAQQALVQLTERERSLGQLGQGLNGLVGLLRHGGLGPEPRASAARLLRAAVDRALWLLEGLTGPDPLDLALIDAVAGLRDAIARFGEELALDREQAAGVLQRVVRGPQPPCIRGAALGALVSLGALDLPAATEAALSAIRSARPVLLGDYLAGLIALAREALPSAEGLLRGVDAALGALQPLDFSLALPSLRVAFRALPARERALVGRQVASFSGQRRGPSLALPAAPEDIARATALEAAVDQLLETYGVSFLPS